MIFLLLMTLMFLAGFFIGKTRPKTHPATVRTRQTEDCKTKEIACFLSYDGSVQE